MRIAPFESEFPPEDVPVITGDPMEKPTLDRHGARTPLWVRTERSQQIAVLNAVHGFYFAKRFSEAFADFNGWTNAVSRRAIEAIEAKLWRLAIIDIASVNDATNLPRAASIQGVLKQMKDVLEASHDPSAVKDLLSVDKIRRETNANVVIPLKYVRHVRNKWAGHPSMDRNHDSWADADKSLSVPLVEEAIALLVRAHQEVADLAVASQVLRPIAAIPPPEGELVDTPNGEVKQFPMTVHWGSVTVWAEFWRDAAQRDAAALVDQVTSPPGYGSPRDTDWSSGSEHAARRSAIDLTLAGEVVSRSRE